MTSVLSVVSICVSYNLDILGVKFDSKLTFEEDVRGIVSHATQRIGILRLVKLVFVDTSVLLRCFVATMLLFSQSLSIVLRCWGLLLNVIFSFSSARCIRWPGIAVIRLSCRCHRRHVAALRMLYKGNSSSNYCLFSELPSASVRVRHTRAAAAAHPLEFEVSRCRTYQLARRFLPAQTRVWNDLPYTVFDTGTLDGFKGAVNRWLLP